ncbi:hypothetical protein MMC25_000561 [Agyrium rufum]|nr:hypothetical protein [Agyrium rufum]
MANEPPPKYESITSHSRRSSSTSSSAPNTPTRRQRILAQQLNEDSPLLDAQRTEDNEALLPQSEIPEELLQYNEQEGAEASKSVWYLFLLTLSIGGLQIAWAVEISNGSPYLLSLGMSKSLLAFVWIAGPLSGTLVQPYVGIMSDNCRSPLGKRTPFMIAGAAATIVSLMALAWTREIIGGLLGLFGASPDSRGVQVTSICFAIAFVYILDFAINTVQAGIRAFIVDNAPAHQQEDANAWAGRITGVGNVLGYLSGYVNLPVIMPFFGNTQFKVLCVIAAVALGGTVAISCIFIRERDPRLEGTSNSKNPGLFAFFRQVFASMRRMPPQIRKVCEVQFFNWIAWFPFLFYITTWIGQLYVNPIFEKNPNATSAEIDEAWEEGTRVATLALLIFAITSFSSNILLPFFIVPSYQAPEASYAKISEQSYPIRPSTPTTPNALSASMSSLFPPSPSPESHSRLTRLLNIVQIPWLTLRRAWIIAHVLFALCNFSTLFISSTKAATVLVACIGLPWALTLWAPFALISAEISKRDAMRRARLVGRAPGATNGNGGNGSHGEGGEEGETDQAGVILGLHNVAVAAPQIIATLVSSLIFRALQKPRGTPGDESVGWVLRFGGVAALIAAYMTTRIEEEGGKGKKRGSNRTSGPGNEGGEAV